MANLPIVVGENALITTNLKQADGVSDLAVADIAEITVELVQNDETKKTWEYDGSTWSTGFRSSGASQVQIELEIEDSTQLEAGAASLRWDIRVTNADFFVAGVQRSIVTEEVFDVTES